MTTPLRVHLKRGRSKPFWVGHPWVFSGAIHKVEGHVGDFGGDCLVVDERGNVLGAGSYNPHGAIAVRIWEHRRTTDREFEARPFEELLDNRLDLAISRRETLGYPSEDTNAYRLVNGEGDGLSGLVVDVFGSVAVAHVGSRGVYERREGIYDLLESRLAVEAVVTVTTEDASRLETIPVEREVVRGSLDGPVEIHEGGVRFQLDPVSGQKTGFYLDQRESRRTFAALCRDRSVLDLYSYVGSFGIHAAMAGATDVTAVDSSSPALDRAQKNAALNGVSDRFTPWTGDAMSYLKAARAEGRKWDRIVCDPPKYAKGRSHLDDALKKYKRLNTLALGALAPGGLLLTCSCSQHVSEKDFLRMITESGHRLRRGVQVHALWGQPADHPHLAVAPEGRYLKVALVGLDRPL